MTLPRITLVTPVLNRGALLRRTMDSVLNQNYPHLDYIVIDGGSSDATISIIKEYSHHLHHWVSRTDSGLYHAINDGFSMSSGIVMGWLNSDDILQKNALLKVGETFSSHPNLSWLTGIATTVDEADQITKMGWQARYRKESFLYGGIRGIQQESTFFRRTLWDKAGGALNTSYQFAADYELWCRFFLYEPLRHIYQPLGAFRRHQKQISNTNMSEYRLEVEKIRHVYRSRLTLRERLLGMIGAQRETSLQRNLYPDFR